MARNPKLDMELRGIPLLLQINNTHEVRVSFLLTISTLHSAFTQKKKKTLHADNNGRGAGRFISRPCQ